MARDWAPAFEAWGQPPSDSEEQERRKTEAEIKAALSSYPPLADKKISIYAKGSYRRGTNVRRGSDVDIAVELLGSTATGGSFLYDKVSEAAKLSDEQLGIRSVHFPMTL